VVKLPALAVGGILCPGILVSVGIGLFHRYAALKRRFPVSAGERSILRSGIGVVVLRGSSRTLPVSSLS
jgi:hypothetical protein